MRKGILLLTIASFATLGMQAQTTGSSDSSSSASSNQAQTSQSNSATSSDNQQAQTSQNNGTSGSNSSSDNAGPKEMAARHGLDMLDQTNKARTAISNKNKQQALNCIQAATNDLQKVRSEAQTKVIPLYQEFASVSVIAPIKAEQKAKASGSNSSGNGNSTQTAQNNGASNSNSDSNGKVTASVHQVRGAYSVMELDTDGAMSHLNAAKTALNNGDWKTADMDLAAVQDGVVFASYRSDLPLVRAQENLILARQNARKGNFQEVHAALASSAKALSAYEKQGGSHVDDAKNLQQQISSYNQHIDQDHKDAVKKIDGWWNTASNWLQNPSSNS